MLFRVPTGKMPSVAQQAPTNASASDFHSAVAAAGDHQVAALRHRSVDRRQRAGLTRLRRVEFGPEPRGGQERTTCLAASDFIFRRTGGRIIDQIQ